MRNIFQVYHLIKKKNFIFQSFCYKIMRNIFQVYHLVRKKKKNPKFLLLNYAKLIPSLPLSSKKTIKFFFFFQNIFYHFVQKKKFLIFQIFCYKIMRNIFQVYHYFVTTKKKISYLLKK